MQYSLRPRPPERSCRKKLILNSVHSNLCQYLLLHWLGLSRPLRKGWVCLFLWVNVGRNKQTSPVCPDLLIIKLHQLLWVPKSEGGCSMADRGGDVSSKKAVRCLTFEWTTCVRPTFMFVCVCVCLPSYVMMMPFKRQALVEFSAVESADRCVSCGAKEPVYIAGLIPRRLTVMRLISYTCLCVCTICVHVFHPSVYQANRHTLTTPHPRESPGRPTQTTLTVATRFSCCPYRTPSIQ